MQSAACKNKGFILDGYPRNINDAKSIFLKPKVNFTCNEEENSDKYPGLEPDSSIIPQYVIVIQGEDAHLK